MKKPTIGYYLFSVYFINTFVLSGLGLNLLKLYFVVSPLLYIRNNVVSFFIGLITDNLYIISGLSFTISLLLIWLIINNQNKINKFLGSRK